MARKSLQQFRYANGFYDWERTTRNDGPAVITVSVKPVEHRGFLIFDRGNPHRHSKAHHVDLVKDGVCVGMRGGVDGCRSLADRMLEDPTEYDAARSLRILAAAQQRSAA